MARPLRGRRETVDGDTRQELANSKARHDTIRMAVRELSRMEAERKKISAEIAEFKATHIKGDLGFKIADFNAIYRISQLETEDRDVLLDTLREGFTALGIGGTLDWVAAAEGQPQPNGADKPRRRRGGADAEPGNIQARGLGREDGLAGHRDHAARYAAGEPGHADYELGHAEGERERHPNGEGDGGDFGEPQPAAAEPPKRRGRPRKAQPELTTIEGGAGAQQ